MARLHDLPLSPDQLDDIENNRLSGDELFELSQEIDLIETEQSLLNQYNAEQQRLANKLNKAGQPKG
jgi:hypothetical protein